MVQTIKILTILSLPFFYLLFSYVRFYHYIGYTNLQSPYVNSYITLNNPQGIGEALYIPLGDSLSAGTGSDDVKKTFVYSYLENLSKTYGKVSVLNLSQPGGTTVDVINNQLSVTIKKNPQYITLLIGTNDIHNKRTLADFRSKYSFIVKELMLNTTAQITIINIPYIGSSKLVYFPLNFFLNYRTKQFNNIISDIVDGIGDKSRIRFVDLYSSTYDLSKQDPQYYSSDEFHPSGEGYVLWGKIINEY
jgi:lysophospholipase L1-like esterase